MNDLEWLFHVKLGFRASCPEHLTFKVHLCGKRWSMCIVYQSCKRMSVSSRLNVDLDYRLLLESPDRSARLHVSSTGAPAESTDCSAISRAAAVPAWCR